MKNKYEPGLEHIKKLNICAFRDARAVYNEFSKKYGQKKSHEIVDSLFEASNKSQSELYDKKNIDYDVAMIFSGGYDADIIRKSCNWIYEHKNDFGNEILEIGCDCGFVTTFLGSLFPYKHITAIERCSAGIEVAKRNVEKFALKNVDFICDDITNISEKKFDTVFSMRTLQENLDDVKECSSNELREEADMFSSAVNKYALKVVSLLKKDGNLISIERLGMNAMFLAWINVLSMSRCKLKIHEQLRCTEMGDDSFFQAMIFTQSDNEVISPYDDFIDCYLRVTDTTLSEYSGWDGKILYDYTGGELILGYEAIDRKNNAKSKIVLRHHKTDNNAILLYNNNEGNVHLYYIDISDKEAAIDKVKDTINEVISVCFLR